MKAYRSTDTSERNDETGGEKMASKGVGTGNNPNSRKGIELNTKEDLYGMAGLMAGLLANGMKGDSKSAKLLLEVAGVFDEEIENEEEKTTGVVMIPKRGDEEDG